MCIIGIKKMYAEIARLYGKNISSIPKVMKIKEKIRARFYVAPQNAYVTAKARDKYLMKLEKALKFWVENMHKKRVPVDDNMIRQIALSLYEGFHKLDGKEEETSPFTACRGWLHRFRNRFKLKDFKIIEQATSGDEEAAATFQTELKIIKDGNYDPRHVFNCD
jgi:primosomal protein N'